MRILPYLKRGVGAGSAGFQPAKAGRKRAAKMAALPGYRRFLTLGVWQRGAEPAPPFQ